MIIHYAQTKLTKMAKLKKKKEVERQHYKLMGVQKKNNQTAQMQEKQLTKFGFTFASDWLKGWNKFSRPITGQNATWITLTILK